MKINNRRYLYIGASFFAFAAIVVFSVPIFFSTTYEPGSEEARVAAVDGAVTQEEKEPPVVHIKTPKSVKAVYMTSCVAGTPSLRNKLVALIEETELNSIVIDIKDYSGNIAFKTGVPLFDEAVGITCRVADLKEFIRTLH